MKLSLLFSKPIATVLACLMATPALAAVGIPENIVIDRPATTDDGVTTPGQIFIVKRTDASNFNAPSTDPILSTGVGLFVGPGSAPVDQLQVADINGDGLDDLLGVRDITGFSGGNQWWTFGQIAQPGPTFPQFELVVPNANGQPNKTSGPVVEEFPITRRDFDGDGFADTANVLDARVFNPLLDQYNWAIQGTFFDGFPSIPLDQFGPFLGAGTGQTTFGKASTDIPLVGDWDGDGIADRGIATNALIDFGVNGRLIQIDLSPSAGNLGDGAPDNGISDLIGIGDDDVRAADVNGDGYDDIVAVRPDPTFDTYNLFAYINNQQAVAGGTDPIFVFDPAYNTSAGVLSLGDVIQFGTFGLIEPDEGQDGDYNGDGLVTALDYAVWRDGASADSTSAGYNAWAGNFGAGVGAASAAAVVPEPTSCGLVLLALTGAAARRRS